MDEIMNKPEMDSEMENNSATGKVIDFKEGEFPELGGVESGQKIPFEGEATITLDKDGNGKIAIENIEFEIENSATKELKKMTKQEGTGEQGSEETGGEF